MPTTQPLDDELGDIAEGPLKSIAGFAQPGAQIKGQAPRAAVPRLSTPQPQTAVASVSTGARHFANVRTPSVGLNGVSATRATANAGTIAKNTVTSTPGRSSVYTEKDILTAWQQFIGANAAEHLLINAMKVVNPAPLGNDTYNIAQSNIHLTYIRDALGRITDYVRGFVNNDKVNFVLEEVSEDSPLVWNDREFLQHVAEEHPAVAKFIIDLGLTLS